MRPPHLWYTWKVIKPFTRVAQKRLEIGAGVIPKFPIYDTYFLDTSDFSTKQLELLGGKAVTADAGEPFPLQDNTFDLIGAFEVLEHIEKPEQTLSEIARVLKPDGLFLFSVPIQQKYWSKWDELAGHVQRFELKQLTEILDHAGFTVDHCYTLFQPSRYSFFALKHLYTALCPVVVRYPNYFYRMYDLSSVPRSWIARRINRLHRYENILDVPDNNSNIFVVTRKMKTA